MRTRSKEVSQSASPPLFLALTLPLRARISIFDMGESSKGSMVVESTSLLFALSNILSALFKAFPKSMLEFEWQKRTLRTPHVSLLSNKMLETFSNNQVDAQYSISFEQAVGFRLRIIEQYFYKSQFFDTKYDASLSAIRFTHHTKAQIVLEKTAVRNEN